MNIFNFLIKNKENKRLSAYFDSLEKDKKFGLLSCVKESGLSAKALSCGNNAIVK